MPVILAQTDTTVGFLSQDDIALASLKGRASDKPFLKVFESLKTLQENVRVPLRYRSFVRHAKRSTFVIKNQAVRYVHTHSHARLIQQYGWLYSTSANQSGCAYDETFCLQHSDIIREDVRGFFSSNPSAIYRITSTQSLKLR